MIRRLCCAAVFLACALFAAAQSGLEPSAPRGNAQSALTSPSYSAEIAFLFDLERRFAKETAAGGGAAFAKWFAEDGVTLSDGQAPVIGQPAIAAQTKWQADKYQLLWTPEGGRMSAGGDMGFTWGHYSGHGRDKQGNPIDTSGRYMTVWKRQGDGSWKVELDASNSEPPQKEDCCKLP